MTADPTLPGQSPSGRPSFRAGAPAVALVLAAVLVVWFALLGHRDLIDPDEGRYAEIPREMLATGDWLTPRLLGFKYFEKPPLQYWATALAYAAFGASTWVARLWPVLLGLAGALWTGWIGRRLFGRDAGDYAFLVTASGLLYFTMGHVLTLDMGVSVFLTVGMGSLALAQSQRNVPRAVTGWMLLGWAALAGAVLSKGLEGLALPLGAVGLYVIWQRDWALLRNLRPGSGLLLLSLLGAPWFVAVSLANPDFAGFFFIHEHLQRFTTTVHHREGPLYYFAAVFLAGALPWVLITVRTLTARELFVSGAAGFRPERLFWVYVMFVLVFFTVSQSKLPAYVLPAWPFAALLVGRRLAPLARWRADGWVLVAVAVVLAAVVALASRFATDTTPLALLNGYRPWVVAAATGFLLAGLAGLLWRGSLKPLVTAMALASMVSLQMLLWGMQALAPSRSGHGLATAIDRLERPAGAPVYVVADYSPSLAFYLRRTPVIVDYSGELAFGMEAEPGRAIDDVREFARRWWRDPGGAVAVVNNRRPAYLGIELPMRVVKRGPRRTLVVKPLAAGTRDRTGE